MDGYQTDLELEKFETKQYHREDTSRLSETILDCDRYFIHLIHDISNANKTIDFESYIYCDDIFGFAVADALSDAAKRGVLVRVLVDGSGTSIRSRAIEQMERNGVKVKIFHPYPWKLWHLRRSNIETYFLFKIFYALSHLNARNHRKTCVIDKNIVYIGSVNVCQRHLSKKYAGENWHDTVVRIKNIATKELEIAFNIAWYGFPLEERIKELIIKKPRMGPFRLNYAWRKRRAGFKELLRKITHSTERVWITSAYFNPNYLVLKKLKAAAQRGVDVKIILPFKSDIVLMTFVAATFYSDLLLAGVKIYEYTPNILHSKVLIIDDWFCVGSSNLNQRSLRHDLEVDVEISSQSAKDVLINQYRTNIQQSSQINADDIKKLPLGQKILARLLLFIKYYL